MRILTVCVVGLAACYRPSAQPGAPCSADLSCPMDQHCMVAAVPPICVSNLVDAGLGDPDGVMADAPTACGTAGPCTNPNPVCDGDTCRGCAQDDECASAACNEASGECWAEYSVAYVAVDGDDSGPCVRQYPCATISTALTRLGGRTVIRVGPGTYHDAPLVTTGDLSISGSSRNPWDTIVVFSRADGRSHTLEVRGAKLFVDSLVLSGGDSDGVRVQDGAGLTLAGVTIEDSGGNGIDVQSADLALFNVTVSGHPQAGVHLVGGTLEVDGAYLDDNGFEGIALDATLAYSVIDAVILHNHRGGVSILGALAPSPAVFEFNTVYSNDGTANAGMRSAAAVTAASSIFADNGATPQVATPIKTTYDLFSDVAAAGTGNLAGSPNFVDPNSGDLHIKFSSPARDAADPGATLDHDYDYDDRPHGPHADIGADESY